VLSGVAKTVLLPGGRLLVNTLVQTAYCLLW